MRWLTAVHAALIATSLLVPAASGTCGSSSMWGANCEATNTGSEVEVGVSESTGDHVPDLPKSVGPGTSDVENAGADEDCPLDRCDITYQVVGPPEVTLEDLASFLPTRPTLGGEPAGFGVVGMPTNLIAAASVQEIPGTVLDWPVTVRFTPVAYVFDNGDGTTTRSTTGGRSWDSLHQARFTPTATSHTYRDRGTYTVTVTVEYAAAVNFGSGTWRPVPGTVRATAPGYDLRVVEVRTALVDRTCTEDPHGPGC